MLSSVITNEGPSVGRQTELFIEHPGPVCFKGRIYKNRHHNPYFGCRFCSKGGGGGGGVEEDLLTVASLSALCV